MPWTWKPFQPLILLTNRKFVLWCCKYEATVRWWHRFILLGQSGEFVVFKRILRCFQLCYGLKINFCKSYPLSIANVQRNWLNFWQATFYAKWSVFLSIVNSYLGSNVEKFEKKLSSWKRWYLSLWAKVTLIKPTLSNFLVYYMPLRNVKNLIAFRKFPIGWQWWEKKATLWIRVGH